MQFTPFTAHLRHRMTTLCVGIIRMLACVLAVLSWAAHAHAAAQAPPPAYTEVPLSWSVAVGEDESIADALRIPDAAWKGPVFGPSLGYLTDTYWFKGHFRLPDVVPPGGWQLEIFNAMLDRAEVYVYQQPADTQAAQWVHWTVGDAFPFDARPVRHHNFVVPVTGKLGSEVIVLMRVTTSSPMKMPVYLWRTDDLKASEIRYLSIQSMYFGLMFGMLLFNLLLLVLVRESVYAYYVVFVVAIVGFTLNLEGLGYEYLWPDAIVWNDRCLPVFLWVLVFTARFFLAELSQFASGKVLTRISPGLFVTLVALLALFAYSVPFRVGILSAMVGYVFVSILSFQSLIHSIKAGDKFSYVYLVAMTPTIVGAGLLILYYIGILPFIYWIQYGLEAGSVFNVMLFSLSLSMRLTQVLELKRVALERLALNERLTVSNAALAEANIALESSKQLSEERTLALVAVKEQSRAEAEQRNRDKSRFLAQSAHDLRQPLQAISNALSPVVSQIKAGHYNQAVFMVDLAQQASQVMRNQIGGLMDLSRLESGLVQVSLMAIPVGRLFGCVVAQFADTAQAKGIRLLSPSTDLPDVMLLTDEQLVLQVLMNLVSNGIKYTDPAKAEGGFVRLSLEVVDRTAWIHVEDNGLGIAEEHVVSGAVFKPFFQINNHLPEAEKGVGLGLSIVHAVIALLPEHQLTVSSQPGSGSRFTLQLPLAEQTSPYFLSDKPPVQHAFTDLKGLYVLLIEDDILVRLSTAALLDFHGILHDDFSVLEELEAYLPKMERCPDLVLSDFRLPRNKTAVDALALIEEVWGAVPILVVSGDAGGQAGADASLDICHQLPLHAEVLKKPVSPERLLATISQLCGSTVRPTVPLI